MMLEHLGEPAAADRLMRAIERVTADPSLHTPDLGGTATTRAVTDADDRGDPGRKRVAKLSRSYGRGAFSLRSRLNSEIPRPLVSILMWR